jgi:hypothetical protein
MKASDKQISYLKSILQSENKQLSDFTKKSFDELEHSDICQLFKVIKTATDKQKVYLQSVLQEEKKLLSEFTMTPIDNLTHQEITLIFKKLQVPIHLHLKDIKYIMKEEGPGYVVGTQLNTYSKKTMNLIVFQYLMVIDWDISSLAKDALSSVSTDKDELLESIKTLLKQFPYTFYIYETFNGFHGYLVSKNFDYYSWDTLKLLKQLRCDKYYIGFTRKIGFTVRLNKKLNRNEEFIEKFVCKINDYPILQELQKLIEIKDNLI